MKYLLYFLRIFYESWPTLTLAWWFTYAASINSFEIIPLQGITFSGPSAEWLMRILSAPNTAFNFDFGMLPAVFVGSFIGAWYGKDLKLEGFKDGYSMSRYIVGAILMGFGAMLAGGCAVGAGITGGAIFALTAWIALIGMWMGAGVADRLLDNEKFSNTPENRNDATSGTLRAP
ncbi:YeeE/YedE thiosulfate transporter family protein [Undibacterium sp. Di24W]|uniref:YeeE/YedE thiosulfate transporter family protein n=1 Tax=Undibacterium sp. Di24W TaxID=3413033 RepID=UPI003BF11944